ncbi:hypothetical protein BUALT_Bualt12G0069300 [Buddleja alternifolia]|uniref:RING-type E3 ubiquitin transferase n=1 Tax=Buddleja alternifolia TaxID=168488 RepID=A0AAV6WQJ6_9LAMI|nr:hypothetical protein BUALT_Bualt12G0069300 [Buddleja alternifolia]
MNWVLAEMKEKSFLSPAQQPYFMFLSPPPPQPQSSSGFSLNNKVSPSILLIIIILAIIFFISGLLHLLVRFLLRPSNRDPDEMDNATALQGQLQQLFHLHDSGVDQSFIDTLPVFNYKAIIGVKDPFDCAVCLCEFEGEDKLRLLPKCSHAFHMDCIDTWLLSHSTCPLCRASLLSDFPGNSNFSPLVLVLESGSQSSREIVSERENCEDFVTDPGQNSGEIQEKEDENQKKIVLSVKLGKFKNVDNNGGEEGSNNNNSNSNSEENNDNNVDARRCFSMGSFAYVMDENTSLQVPIITTKKQSSSKKQPLTPGHRLAMSECGCDSTREFKFNGLEACKVQRDVEKGIFGRSSKRESFSVSKIWLRGKKDKANGAEVESSRRAFSFRFPVGADEAKGKNGRRTISEIDMSRWENGRSEIGFDEEIQSCNSLDCEINHTPSFARRTLLWIMGKQNKVVHHQSSFSSNV